MESWPTLFLRRGLFKKDQKTTVLIFEIQTLMRSTWRRLNVVRRSLVRSFLVWSNTFQLMKCKTDRLLFCVILNRRKCVVLCPRPWLCVLRPPKKSRFWRHQQGQLREMLSPFQDLKVYFIFKGNISKYYRYTG